MLDTTTPQPFEPASAASKDPDRNLVWLDAEMTGLYPGVDALVEVAIIITDADLNILDKGIDIIIKPPAAAVEQMDPVVVAMHAENGLAEQWEHGVSAEEAEQQLLGYVKKFCPEPRTALLAGNTVGQDQRFLLEEMPQLAAHLHYRIVDVSSIKELAKRWYPHAYEKSPEKLGNHRALGDITDSINELRYYREAIMVPPPGPNVDEARKVRDELVLYVESELVQDTD
ncbi:oligoribonuclease [Enteractinococcus coprophilus]|uniref:oligoribonuclease n=1 Tax=Enteractinococcus coprophilus TaxID=1027633 RepID=UPI00364FCFF7